MKRVMLVFVLIFAISFVSAAIPVDCPANMVSFWKFDGDATDSIEASGNDGTGIGVTYGSGKVEEALRLGFSENVIISDDINPPPPGPSRPPTRNQISYQSISY